MKCLFRNARHQIPSCLLAKLLGQFLRSGTTTPRVLKALNQGFGLLSSNLLLKMRQEAVGEVKRGMFKDLQTGSWPPGCVLTSFRFRTKIRSFSIVCNTKSILKVLHTQNLIYNDTNSFQRYIVPKQRISVIMHQSQALPNAGGMSKNLGVQAVP